MMPKYCGMSAEDYQIKGMETQMKGSIQVEKDKTHHIYQNNGQQNQNKTNMDLEYQKTSNSSDKVKETWEKGVNKFKARDRQRKFFKERYWKRKRLHTYKHKKSKIKKGKQKHNKMKSKSRHARKTKIRSKWKQQHWSKKKQVPLGVNIGQRIFTSRHKVSHKHSKKRTKI